MNVSIILGITLLVQVLVVGLGFYFLRKTKVAYEGVHDGFQNYYILKMSSRAARIFSITMFVLLITGIITSVVTAAFLVTGLHEVDLDYFMIAPILVSTVLFVVFMLGYLFFKTRYYYNEERIVYIYRKKIKVMNYDEISHIFYFANNKSLVFTGSTKKDKLTLLPYFPNSDHVIKLMSKNESIVAKFNVPLASFLVGLKKEVVLTCANYLVVHDGKILKVGFVEHDKKGNPLEKVNYSTPELTSFSFTDRSVEDIFDEHFTSELGIKVEVITYLPVDNEQVINKYFKGITKTFIVKTNSDVLDIVDNPLIKTYKWISISEYEKEIEKLPYNIKTTIIDELRKNN